MKYIRTRYTYAKNIYKISCTQTYTQNTHTDYESTQVDFLMPFIEAPLNARHWGGRCFHTCHKATIE